MSETSNIEQAAWDELERLTSAPGGPGNAWRWSIPARPDRDSDLILAAGLKAVADERDAAIDQLAQIASMCSDSEVVLGGSWVHINDLRRVLKRGTE